MTLKWCLWYYLSCNISKISTMLHITLLTCWLLANVSYLAGLPIRCFVHESFYWCNFLFIVEIINGIHIGLLIVKLLGIWPLSCLLSVPHMLTVYSIALSYPLPFLLTSFFPASLPSSRRHSSSGLRNFFSLFHKVFWALKQVIKMSISDLIA